MSDIGKMLLGGIAAPSVEKGIQNLGNASLNPNKAILDEEEKKKRAMGKGMKKGGYVKAADGCCKKGKTKGKMV